MRTRLHQAKQHKLSVPGIEAVTFTSDHAFPRHSHEQFGIGVIDFGAHRSWSAVGAVSAHPGDVIMVNPGEMHDGAPVAGAARGWRMIYLNAEWVDREAEDGCAGRIEIVRPVARDAKLAQAFNRLFAAITSSCTDRLATEESLISTIMMLLRSHTTARPIANGGSTCVAKALQRLDDAANEQVSLAELAAVAGLSRFKLLRSFAREVGITPHAYLIQRRLAAARRLLASGHTPVQAAMQAGFADQSHLTRAFVRYFGVTPARYRAAVS